MKLLRDYIPALKYGAKILPNDMAGMIGLPYVGNIIYVDPTSGSDTANGGGAQNDALATVAAAYEKATSAQHDVVIIAPTGGTGRTAETSAITWAKRFTHLIGNAAPVVQDNRAGIGFSTGGSLTISENGCMFKNLTMFSSADIDVTVTLSGNYNSFSGVDFKGNSNATSIGSTPWRALKLSAAEENYFGGCTFGGDTYLRSAANANIEFASTGNARNVFEDCLFSIRTDDADALFIKAASAAQIDRFAWFKNCFFHNTMESGSTTMTIGMSIHAAVGGTVVLDGCSIHGVTNWSDDYTTVYGMNMPDVTAANAGFLEKITT